MRKDKVGKEREGKGREGKGREGKEREGLKSDKCVICYTIVESLPVNRVQPNLVCLCRSPTYLLLPILVSVGPWV